VTADPSENRAEPGPDEMRIDELARAGGTTVRNVRAYQDRGLLPPPRRIGRTAWYGPGHVVRLRLIGSMLERGYSLGNIAELLDNWNQGRDLGDLLGLGRELIGLFRDEVPELGTIADILERYGLTLEDPAVVEQALALHLVEVDPDGQRVQVPSPRLLRAGVELARLGIPLDDLFAELQKLRTDVGVIAGRFLQMVVRHVIEPQLVDGVPSAGNAADLAGVVLRMRPLATKVITAELDLALQREAEAEFGQRLMKILAGFSHSGSDPAGE
jgi:DNA-binding transcriptional MerR regulator